MSQGILQGRPRLWRCALGAQLALLALVGVALAGPAWQVMPNAPTSIRLDDIVFLDEQTGWVADYEGFVHRTTDGGATWQSVALPGVPIRSLCFTSRTRGWAGTLVPSSPLLSTEDGGVSWSPVMNLPDPQPAAVCGMRAVTDRVVYGVGRYYGPPIVIKTTDGGATWATMDLTPFGALSLIDCHFVDADSGFVVGSAGTSFSVDPVPFIASTWNGGATWDVRHHGTLQHSWCWKVSFPSRRVGYVSLEARVPSPDVLKTTDGGLTWSEIPSFAPPRVQGLGFVTEERGWVAADVRVYTTNDGGETWTEDRFGIQVNRIQFLSPMLGFASGRTVYKFAEPTAVQRRNVSDIKRIYRPAKR